ncbi:MAG: hypothetical protein JWN72_360, partial [Thermoleophilia bacterium]|nr:hypothetical protein [Thermoleophilia bacterium]
MLLEQVSDDVSDEHRVVYGMPRQVVEHDLADATGTIAELPVLIERALGTPLPN